MHWSSLLQYLLSWPVCNVLYKEELLVCHGKFLRGFWWPDMALTVLNVLLVFWRVCVHCRAALPQDHARKVMQSHLEGTVSDSCCNISFSTSRCFHISNFDTCESFTLVTIVLLQATALLQSLFIVLLVPFCGTSIFSFLTFPPNLYFVRLFPASSCK